MTATPESDLTAVERSLLAVAYRAADLAVLASADDVIRAVVQGTQEMFSSDVAYFTMHDEQTDEFYVRETVGFRSGAFLHDRSAVRGFGIYGYIIDHLRPFWTSDYDNDTRFEHHPINVSSIQAEGIKALAGAPAVLPGRAMPAVVFAGYRSSREFTDDEIGLLVAWGKVAGAAVENALRRDDQAAALQQARASAEQLGAEAAELREMAEVEARLSELVTSGATLDELVEELSRLLDGSVVVRDDRGNVQGSGSDGGAAELPEDVVGRSFDERRAVTALDPSGAEIVVAAVRGQTELVGSVAVRLDRPARQRELQVLERGAVHVAALMLSRDRLAAAANRAIADIVVGLLRQPQDDVEALAAQASRHGVQLRGRVGMVVADLDGLAAGRSLERARGELGAQPALVSVYSGTLVVLMNGPADPGLADRLLRALARENVVPTVVVSAGTSPADELPEAFAAAQRCLRLAIALGRRGQVVPDAELAPYTTVFGRLSAEELSAYLEELIGPLVAHDRQRGTDLVATLHAYLRSGGSVRTTAEQLYLHPNTVRQRIATIATVLPHFDDADRHLDLHLALRLHDLRTTGG